VNPRIPGERLLQAIQDNNYPFWFPKSARNLALDYFAYGTDFLPLAAGQTANNQISINSDSAFQVLAVVAVETSDDDLTFLGQNPVLVQISEGGSARNFFNQPLHFNNVFGTAELPMVWPLPKLLLPNSTVQVQLQNLEPTDRNVRIAFHGFKIFNFVK